MLDAKNQILFEERQTAMMSPSELIHVFIFLAYRTISVQGKICSEVGRKRHHIEMEKRKTALKFCFPLHL